MPAGYPPLSSQWLYQKLGVGCQVIRFGLLFFCTWEDTAFPHGSKAPIRLVSAEWNWLSQPLTPADLFPDQIPLPVMAAMMFNLIPSAHSSWALDIKIKQLLHQMALYQTTHFFWDKYLPHKYLLGKAPIKINDCLSKIKKQGLCLRNIATSACRGGETSKS